MLLLIMELWLMAVTEQEEYSEQDGPEHQQHAVCFLKLILRVTAYEWDKINK